MTVCGLPWAKTCLFCIWDEQSIYTDMQTCTDSVEEETFEKLKCDVTFVEGRADGSFTTSLVLAALCFLLRIVTQLLQKIPKASNHSPKEDYNYDNSTGAREG